MVQREHASKNLNCTLESMPLLSDRTSDRKWIRIYLEDSS